MAWHYVRDNATQGPVDLAQLQQLRRQGVVQDSTPVWTDGMTEWSVYGKTPAVNGPIMAVVDGVSVATRPCVECGRVFPEDEMLQYEGNWVCAACKPLFFQRLKEGIALPGNLVYASVGRRFAALVIDAVVIYTILLVIGMAFFFVMAMMLLRYNPAFSLLLDLFYLVGWAVYQIVMIGKFGATLGKMALKIKVVRADGGPVSYSQATGRYFGSLLSYFTIFIGYLMAFWDPQRRALHDMLANTRVISTEAA